MPKRPTVTARKFGEWLEARRGAKRSLEQIASRVRPYVEATGLKVNASLIYKLEQGRVPSWPLLAALARVYSISMADITSRLTAALEFPGANSLIGPISILTPAPQADDHRSLAARVQELEDQVSTYELMMGNLNRLGREIVATSTTRTTAHQHTATGVRTKGPRPKGRTA